MKLLISATNKEKAEELLNKYFYSTSYKIEDEFVFNKNGQQSTYIVKYVKGRVKVYRVEEISAK